MRFRVISAFLFVLALAIAAKAQTRISGVLQCAKPDPQHMIQVGDRPNHVFVISQSKCTWTKPFEMAGIEAKEQVDTGFSEISGDTARDRGYGTGTMANGDNYHVRWQGRSTLKAGALQSVEGKWSFTRGTAKLKGLKGQGTFKCTPAGEGTSCDVEGEYQLPK